MPGKEKGQAGRRQGVGTPVSWGQENLCTAPGTQAGGEPEGVKPWLGMTS